LICTRKSAIAPALLGRETDPPSRRALAAANLEPAGLMAKVGQNDYALAAYRAVLAAGRARAAEPGAGRGSTGRGWPQPQ
jgi:hypothetical protein